MLSKALVVAGVAALAAGTGTAVGAIVPPGFSGGQYATASGETVTVYSSPAYASDPAFNQGWADFLGSLPHGPELSELTLLLAPVADVGRTCGRAALGCYSSEDAEILATGDDLPDITAKSIVAHEYGHHIEHNRSNPPFNSDNYGPKRWASLLNVCSGSESGSLFPGDEGANYQFNPAEVFAEDYRALAERQLGLPASGWHVVDPSFIPGNAVLDAVDEDVTSPWTGNTSVSYSGSFSKGSVVSRAFRIATPLDGTLSLTLHGPRGSDYDVRVLDAGGRTLLAQSPLGSKARVKTVSMEICGQRSFVVRVRRTSGSGPFRLFVSRP